MALDPDIKTQIYSLKLSNIDTCGQIQLFLSYFTLDGFPSLRSLTLIGMDKNNFDNLKYLLPLLSKSCSIHIIDPEDELKGELAMRRLTRFTGMEETSECHLPFLFELSSVTHITFPSCSCLDLSHLFEHLPLLEYVKINYVYRGRWTNYYQTFSNQHAAHLKQLVITSFYDDYEHFEKFEMLVKQTPNLKYLLISTHDRTYMMDAPRWEKLITSSLPLLTTFKFGFVYFYRHNENETLFSNKFRQFETEFWTKQHHWHTERVFDPNRADIHTIPYLSNAIGYNDIPRKSQAFDNTTDLTVSLVDLKDNHERYLKNIKTLRITKAYFIPDNGEENVSVSSKKRIPVGGEYIEYLKMIINLSNLHSLDVTQISIDDISSLLLEIFKQAPNLSSLKAHCSHLRFMMENDELCGYLNNMIKKVDVHVKNSLINQDNREKFCEIFSNVEQLSCKIEHPSDLVFLLNGLKNLSIMNAVFEFDFEQRIMLLMEDEVKKGNLLFHVETILARRGCLLYDATKLTIWIGNNVKIVPFEDF